MNQINNLDKTDKNAYASLVIHQPIGQVLEAVVKMLKSISGGAIC